jgi:hypothetical protein
MSTPEVAQPYLCALMAGAVLLASQPSLAQSSMQINANQSLGSVGVFRDEVGRRVSFVCPAGDGKTLGTIYGTDVYVESSPICPAAIHAGALKAGQAGVVTIVLGTGAESFTGSERNGVASRSYGRHGYSYSFTRDSGPGTINWRTAWNWNERPTVDLMEPIDVACPAGGKPDGVIYGTDVYTLDSAICVAAVHAGAITVERGGVVTVTRAPALREDPGVERFGIVSRRRGATAGFSVKAANASVAQRAPLQIGRPGNADLLGQASAPTNTPPQGAAGRLAPSVVGQNAAPQKAPPPSPTTSSQEPLNRAPTSASGRPAISTADGGELAVPPNTIGRGGSGSAPAGPPPTALAVTGTPAIATITWTAPAGATGFDVYRSQPAGSWTKINPSPLSATRFEDQTGFVAGTRYIYRVVSQFAGGAGAYAEASFQPPSPVNPAWAKATAQGKDVVVTWAPVPGVTRYTVAGQSTAEWRDVPASVTSVTYYNVPPGSYEYRIASIYEPGAVQSALAAWTLATISTRPTSGRYRISIAGLRVNNHTHDDLLHADGRADEIYAAAVVAEVDRQTRGVRRTDFVQSEVHGDANGYANRQQAGSASPTGGLVRGDAVPSGFYPQSPPSSAASLPGRFPLTLWEGTLNDGVDAVVIRPTLWEWDGNSISLYAWRDHWLARTSSLWPTVSSASAGTSLAMISAGRTPFFHTAMGQPVGGTAYDTGYELAAGRDRPIGLDDLVLNNPQGPFNDYSRVYLVEAALTGPSSQQLAPGVVAMPLVEVDTPSVETTINGDYVVYLRVERLP